MRATARPSDSCCRETFSVRRGRTSNRSGPVRVFPVVRPEIDRQKLACTFLVLGRLDGNRPDAGEAAWAESVPARAAFTVFGSRRIPRPIAFSDMPASASLLTRKISERVSGCGPSSSPRLFKCFATMFLLAPHLVASCRTVAPPAECSAARPSISAGARRLCRGSSCLSGSECTGPASTRPTGRRVASGTGVLRGSESSRTLRFGAPVHRSGSSPCRTLASLSGSASRD